MLTVRDVTVTAYSLSALTAVAAVLCLLMLMQTPNQGKHRASLQTQIMYTRDMENMEPKLPADIPLCAPCREARAAWLDYRLPPVLGIAYGSGAPYDVSAAGIRDRQRARFEEWRSTVRFHRDLIARTCRTAGHVAEPPIARVIQLDLFAELEKGADSDHVY